jgi:type I restriction enzyme S subunit
MEVRKGYKKTEVGVIPVEWIVNKLGDITHVATGSTPPTNDLLNYGEDFFFVSPADLGKGKYVTNTEKKLSKKGFETSRKYPPNSILFTCIGSTIGKAAIAPVQLTSNQQINAIFPNETYSTDYLYYSLCLLSPRVKALAGEQAVPIVNKSEFEETLIPLPPKIAEQTAIATALSDTDGLISSLERLIAKKRAIKQGAMQELLTGKKRLPGFTGKWEDKALGEIVCINMGQSPDSKNYNFSGIGIPLIQGNADIENRLSIKRVWTTQITKTCDMGDLILTVRAPVGSIGVATEYSCLGRGVCSLKPTHLQARFLYHAMIFSENKWKMLEQGSTFTSANSTQIGSFNVMVPPTEAEQTAIAAILSNMDSEIESLEKMLCKYRLIKQGMMQELLIGKTRLV